MLKQTRTALAVAIFAVVFAASAMAQGPGPQGPGGGSFGAMREQYKYTGQLMRMVAHIGQIDKDKKFALTPAQAKQVLGVLKPLRSQPKLTQDQAKAALKALKAIFTVDQLNAMAAIKDRPRRMDAGGPGGPPGQGGPGAQRRFDPNAMKDRNPLYTKNKPIFPGAPDRKKRTDDFFKALETKAKSAAKPPAKNKPAKRN
jgi:hypothetical protein